MDVDEAVGWTSAETEVDKYDHYINAELQLPDNYGMKWMTRVRQRLHGADVNPEGTGNYREWVDHTEYEIEFFDWSTSKLTVNIISKNTLSQVDS